MADRIDPEIRPESFPSRKISQSGIGSASAITTGASEWLATFRLPEQLGSKLPTCFEAMLLKRNGWRSAKSDPSIGASMKRCSLFRGGTISRFRADQFANVKNRLLGFR